MEPTSTNGQVGATRPVDDLIKGVLGTLQKMRSMTTNWDGYNADPPLHSVLDYGARFLEVFLRTAAQANRGRGDFPLVIAPAVDGGLFVQIGLPPVELEFDICPDLSIDYLRTNDATGDHEEGRLDPRPTEAIPELANLLIGFLQPA
ncbi:MAG TPA: hypothetical protein VH120_20480 [Gemmataceae bacterium]|nr:hypothetical protein [Gemmataceae bacterium]